MAEGARARRQAPNPAPVSGSTVSIDVGAGKTNPAALDPIIHVRVRLGIVSALAVEDSLSFNELKERLATSDGNLSVHARRLEEAGYVEIRKSFQGRIPRTDYRLTETGRQALERYLEHMEALIERVRE
ncbi:MAG: winged helix-turn-helix domain-containing protein [Gemmatimonadota bacterium]